MSCGGLHSVACNWKQRDWNTQHRYSGNENYPIHFLYERSFRFPVQDKRLSKGNDNPTFARFHTLEKFVLMYFHTLKKTQHHCSIPLKWSSVPTQEVCCGMCWIFLTEHHNEKIINLAYERINLKNEDTLNKLHESSQLHTLTQTRRSSICISTQLMWSEGIIQWQWPHYHAATCTSALCRTEYRPADVKNTE